MTNTAFAESMIALGQHNGYVLGLKRAIEFMRNHGLDVMHPARTDVFNELMDCTRDSVQAIVEQNRKEGLK